MRTVEAFVRLSAIAHGRPQEDRKEGVGLGEQVAAIHLVADTGRRDASLTAATYAFFDAMSEWLGTSGHDSRDRLQGAIEEAKLLLPPR
jgi:hypothetical protein